MTIESIASVSNKTWQIADVSDREVLYLMQQFNISEIAARIMASRGIINDTIANHFLNPLLRTTLPDPFHLLDMKRAVERVITAIQQKEKIVIFGDYDVDGATSSSLLKKYLADLGIQVSIYIPDRIKEGYGPNYKALVKLQESGNSLCITVDCGTVAHEAFLNIKGLDIIVIDHHLGGETLPKAHSIINPNRLDEDSEYNNLAAVGVSFLFLIALNKTLRDDNFFTQQKEPNLYEYLDLVALGTVCDVMKLQNLNRTFVAQGLKVMAQRKNLGIRVLADLLQIYEPLTSYHLGFLIGPNINAGGRVGKSDLGANLLSTTDETEARIIAQQLILHNKERQGLERLAIEEAINQVKCSSNTANVIILTSDNWHPGIIGLIASRVKDFFHLPTIVITIQNRIGKASCRSVPEIDIGALVLEAKLRGIIMEGGGHKMAAGFSIAETKISELNEFLNIRTSNTKIQNTVKADALITPQSINLKLWNDLQKIAPFGSGNPEPKFILYNIFLSKVEVMKDQHIRCFICDKTTKKSVKAIAFRVINTDLGNILLNNTAQKILGKIQANYWQGRVSINFIIEDAMSNE